MAHRRILSFKYAIEGIAAAFKEEPNMRVHAALGGCALFLGAYFQIAPYEWLALFLTVGMVLSMELTNAAIEAVVDSFTDQIHPAAKLAKDISAGAVLVGAVMAVAVGLIIFGPHLLGYAPVK